MKIINLREYYSQFAFDYLLKVAEEIAFCLENEKRQEHAYQMRRHRNRAYFSLDRNDGIENEILFAALSPHEIYERNLARQELHAAISNLPDKQAKRIYAHFFLNMSCCTIANVEGVGESAVRASIHRGLSNMKKFLKNYW